MENALVRGRGTRPAEIGDNVLIGPHAHVNGAVVSDGGFLATGSSLFPGSRLAPDVEVRINGIVHANSTLAAGAPAPIACVAVGDPAQILAPAQRDDIQAIQRTLDFPGTVYGVAPGNPAAEVTAQQAGRDFWPGAASAVPRRLRQRDACAAAPRLLRRSGLGRRPDDRDAAGAAG
jgi:hypothetical protein